MSVDAVRAKGVTDEVLAQRTNEIFQRVKRAMAYPNVCDVDKLIVESRTMIWIKE